MPKPSLRKPFYNSTIPTDWTSPEFGSVFSFLKSFSFSREQLIDEETSLGVRNIHYGDIHATFENEILDFETEYRILYVKDGLISKKDIASKDFPRLEDGDLVLVDASEDYEGICDCVELKNLNGNVVVGGLHTFVARSKKRDVAFGFRTYVLKHPQVMRELRRIATGISVYGVSKTNLATIKIPLPPLPEQKAIAHILSLMDTVISKNNFLITKKELQKKWLMQNLLTGKKRLKGFRGEWKINSISNVVTRVRKSFSPNPDKMYREIGIRSHVKGIFHKEPKSGKAIGEKRVFWIEPDCFILNIVFAWEHAIAKTTASEVGMIASHRFPMYKPKKDILDLDYLLYYFSSKRGKHLLGIASPGGAGRNRTIGQEEFLQTRIPIPSIQEQTAIAQLLNAVGKEIQLLKNKTEKLKEKKKGLMQVLLTGKKRLIIDALK